MSWIQKYKELIGPNNTGDGAVDYLQLTGIKPKDANENQVKILVQSYVKICGNSRKFDGQVD